MLTIAKFDRYDLVNTPGDDKPAFTVWFSGCSLGCDGCYNPKLQDKKSGTEYESDSAAFFICREMQKQDLDTVVFLGGEPLEQNYESLLKLAHKLYTYGYKIWLYTGYDIDQIPGSLKSCLYTIKCGKYDKKLKKEGFPASSNQKIYRMDDNKWNEISL